MGNAKLWWYPDINGTLEAVGVGGPLSRLTSWDEQYQVAAEALTGAVYALQYGARIKVKAAIEKIDISRASLIRDLMAIDNHLRRGGWISLAADESKAQCGFLAVPPARGDTSITIDRQPWDAWATGAVVAGDELVIQGPAPRMLMEIVTVQAVSGTTLTVDAIRYDYTDEPWVIGRYRDFYPILRLPINQRKRAIMKTDYRILHTWSVVLEEPPDALDAYAGLGDVTLQGGANPGQYPTLEGLLDQYDVAAGPRASGERTIRGGGGGWAGRVHSSPPSAPQRPR